MKPDESPTRTLEVAPAGPVSAPAAAAALEGQSTERRAARHAQLKWLVAGVMAGLLIFAAVRVWFVQGLFGGVRIEGPSMAPGFLGAHYRLICEDCQFPFACDADDPPASREAVCPNCGYLHNALDESSLRPGQTVLIDRWPPVASGTVRNRIVAAQDPLDPQGLVIKRIAALPGERLEIRAGDLHVNGRILRKTFGQLRQVRLLVHDHQYQPQTRDLPERWERLAAGHARWQPIAGGYRHSAAPPEAGFAWLRYDHWRCTAGPTPRAKRSPILDNDSYNQAPSRELNEVRDVQLSLRLLAHPGGQIALAALDGERRFEVIFDFDAIELTLTDDGREVLRQPLPLLLIGRSQIDFGLCDRQVLLAIDGRTVIAQSYESPPRAATPPTELPYPLAIGVRGGSAEVTELRIWRDVYYLDPVGLPRPWRAERTLPDWHLALLGDNTPVSIDSRQWPAVGVPVGSIRGAVLHPFWRRPE